MRKCHVSIALSLALFTGAVLHGTGQHAPAQLRRTTPPPAPPAGAARQADTPAGIALTEEMLREYVELAPTLKGAPEPAVRAAIKGRTITYDAYQYVTGEVERLAAEHRRRGRTRDALNQTPVLTPDDRASLKAQEKRATDDPRVKDLQRRLKEAKTPEAKAALNQEMMQLQQVLAQDVMKGITDQLMPKMMREPRVLAIQVVGAKSKLNRAAAGGTAAEVEAARAELRHAEDALVAELKARGIEPMAAEDLMKSDADLGKAAPTVQDEGAKLFASAHDRKNRELLDDWADRLGALIERGPQEQAVVNGLQSADARLRAEAVPKINLLSRAEQIAVVRRMLTDESPEVRAAAVGELDAFRPLPPRLVDAVITGIVGDERGPVASVRHDAAEEVARAGAAAVPLLAAALASPSAPTRNWTLDALALMAERVGAARRSGPSDGDEREQVRVALRAQVRAMANLTEDPSPGIRARAARAVALCGGGPDLVVPIATPLLKDPDASTRTAALAALAACGPGAADVAPAVALLVRETKDFNDVKTAAATLAALGPVGGDALVAAYGGLEESKRMLMLAPLKEAADRDPTMRPAWEALLAKAQADPSVHVKFAAAQVIRSSRGGSGATAAGASAQPAPLTKAAGAAPGQPVPDITMDPEAMKALESLPPAMREQVMSKLKEATAAHNTAAAQTSDEQPARPEKAATTKEDEYLLSQLRSENPQEHTTAMMGLEGLSPAGKEKAAPVMIERLKNANDQEQRLAVVTFMRYLGPAAKEAVPLLIPMLEKGDFNAHLNVAMTLGAIGPAAKDALPALEKAKKTSPMPMLFDGAIAGVRGEPTAGNEPATGTPPPLLRRSGQ